MRERGSTRQDVIFYRRVKYQSILSPLQAMRLPLLDVPILMPKPANNQKMSMNFGNITKVSRRFPQLRDILNNKRENIT
jgi:hypothetical protein